MKSLDWISVSMEEVEWKPSRHPGVRYRSLRFDRETGAGAMILDMAPGTSYPAHVHTAGEDVLILEGELIIGSGRHGRGSYIYSPPGSTHAPRTEKGCRMFIVLPGKVEEIDR